jgi:hypothetical protein
MIILLNGPPRSGKDTAAEFIILMLGNSKVYHDKLSKPMKSSLTRIFNFNNTEVKALEGYKDQSNGPEYGDLSWRGMQIEMFKHLKETYGPEVLGRLFVRRNRDNAKRHTVISDCGLKTELMPIIESNTYGNIGLIHLDRPGCNFDNDIREDVDPKGIKLYERINNQYDMEMFQAQIRKVLRKWELLDGEDN